MENQLVKAVPQKKGGTGRSSEKRRERSKVAARCRRSKESEIFSELAEFLPLPESTRNSLDKASVMRLSLSDLKLQHMMERAFPNVENEAPVQSDKILEDETEVISMLNNAMGGFLLVLSTEGDIIYASDSITAHLGLAQVEVMGLSIYDFSHPCDHGDIKDLLAVTKKECCEEDRSSRSSSFRMKCTITARGRNVHLRAASYKVIDFTGRMFAGNAKDPDGHWFVGIGEPLLHPSDVDIPLNKQTFLTKHTPDMKCEFVDDSVQSFLGYNPEDIIGKSIFEFHHASDGLSLAKSFKSLYVKGQSITQRYRFLAKHGGWVWVITQATLIQSSNSSKPNSIVCLNFVTSGIENDEEIMSTMQKRPVGKPVKVLSEFRKSQSVLSRTEVDIMEEFAMEKENVLPEIIPESKPITSTKTVIAPRTEDMDSGFLLPVDKDNTLMVSKEEPEDLTHLAPIAGDACVPLDQQIPLLDNLLKELEEANVQFTYNGFEIDVNLDDLPQLRVPVESSSPSNSHMECDDMQVCGETSISLNVPSPLFLNSDPPMVSSPGSKSSLLSPFQLSPNPGKPRRSDSDSGGSLSSPYEIEHSPSSSGGYENSRSPIPGLVGLAFQEDSFRGSILADGHLNDTGPGTSVNYNISDSACSASQPDYVGAFVTLPDGRKFPVIPTSNPNEFILTGDPKPTQTLADKMNLITGSMRNELLAPRKGKQAIEDSIGGVFRVGSQTKPSSSQIQLIAPSTVNEVYGGFLKGGGAFINENWTGPQVLSREGNSGGNLYCSTTGAPVAKTPRMSIGQNSALETMALRDPSKEYDNWYEAHNGNHAHQILNPKGMNFQLAGRSPANAMPTGEVMTAGTATNVHNTSGKPNTPAELELRSCLEQLLATGQGNKVVEIMTWLRASNLIANSEELKPPEKNHGGGLLGMQQKEIPHLLLARTTANQRKRNNHGYLLNPNAEPKMGVDVPPHLPGLHELTRQDCEVNAPLNGVSRLLNGAELLTALENDNIMDPFA